MLRDAIESLRRKVVAVLRLLVVIGGGITWALNSSAFLLGDLNDAAAGMSNINF
jgi:hypothetical protein